MFGMGKDHILGFLRHLVTFVGGILVARGKLDPTAVESIGGALVTIVGFVLSGMSPEKTTPSTPVATEPLTVAPPPSKP